MPFRTIWEKEGIKWEFYDFVSALEIGKANKVFFDDPRSKNSKYQLIDTLETTGVEWDPLNIVEISVNDVAASRTLERLKLAYIVKDNKIREKIEKYVEVSRSLNTNWHFRGFENEEDARLWIIGA